MIDKADIITVISKAVLIGTGIVFGTNILCLAIGYILTKDKPAGSDIGLITAILAIVGIIDLIFGFVLKARLLKPLFDQSNPPDEEALWKVSLRTIIVISAICAALPIYGLVSLLIDGNINTLVGFAIASLAGFMLLRLRPRDFRKLEILNHLGS